MTTIEMIAAASKSLCLHFLNQDLKPLRPSTSESSALYWSTAALNETIWNSWNRNQMY